MNLEIKQKDEQIGHVMVNMKVGGVLHVGESEVLVLNVGEKNVRLRVTAPRRIKISRSHKLNEGKYVQGD
jgi:hypothetical protein